MLVSHKVIIFYVCKVNGIFIINKALLKTSV